MAQQRAEYTAKIAIEHNGVRAYSPGDPVDARAVRGGGPDGWIDPEDVEPSGVIPLPLPAKNATQGAWADYAIQHGADPGQAAGMSRAELIAFTEEQAAGPQKM
jgi:hypothetical protein